MARDATGDRTRRAARGLAVCCVVAVVAHLLQLGVQWMNIEPARGALPAMEYLWLAERDGKAVLPRELHGFGVEIETVAPGRVAVGFPSGGTSVTYTFPRGLVIEQHTVDVTYVRSDAVRERDGVSEAQYLRAD